MIAPETVDIQGTDSDRLAIGWHESGGPDVVASVGSGFRSKLITSTNEGNLDGKVAQHRKADGLRVVIELNVPVTIATEGHYRVLEGLTVLYLEDEPIVAMDTGAHLDDLGFSTVEVAVRLAAAEALAEENTFDLAILDIDVDRGQTSLALGKALADKGTRVIFASGNGCDAPTLKAQGFAFLDKPFSLDGLTAKLRIVAAA